MKPFKHGISCSAVVTPSRASASASLSSVSQIIRGGDQSTSPWRPRESLRGGSTQAAPQLEEDRNEYEEDDYYYADGDDGDDGEAEYEYYEDEDDGNLGEGEDGYYYADEYDHDEGEGIYLPETDDDGYELVDVAQTQQQRSMPSKQRKLSPSSIRKSLRPITSKATLSITGALPAAIPGAISNLSKCLSKLPSTTKSLLSPVIDIDRFHFVNITGSVMVISVVMLALVAKIALAMGGSGNQSFGSRKSNGKKKRRKRGKNASRRKGGMRWTAPWKSAGKSEADDTTMSKFDEEKDGEFDQDYSREFSGEEDEDTMDLDLEDDENVRKSSLKEQKRNLIPSPRSFAKLVPSTTASGVRKAWARVCTMGNSCRPNLRFGLGDTRGDKKKSVTESTSVPVGRESTEDIPGRVLDSTILSSPAAEEAIAKADQLQQELDTLSESHDSLEHEYEASLRMLHEARIELRQLQSNQPATDDSDDDAQLKQKQQMEAMVKKLELKYKSQMKEKIEQIKSQMENKLRSEMEVQLTSKITSQLQEEIHEERTQFEEQLQSEMETRIAESKQLIKDELTANFQHAVDEAVGQEVDRTLDEAIQNTIEAEQQKSHEEMLRVRSGIQKVLERERRLMKEQVRKATGQVREWVMKSQQEQLLMQAKQLQEEAEKFGGASGRDGGRGGGSGERGVQRSGGNRGSPSQRQGAAARRGSGGNSRAGGGNRGRPSRPMPRDRYDDDGVGGGN